MPDLATDLRGYLDAMVDSIDESTAPTIDLAPDQPESSHRRRGFVLVGAAAVLVAIAGWALSLDDSNKQVSTVDDPSPTSAEQDSSPRIVPWDALGPGWHEIDTGPVPAVDFPNLAWSGEELFLAVSAQLVYSYDPGADQWTELPRLPDDMTSDRPPGLVATDVGVLAVEDSNASVGTALLAPGADRWTDLGQLDVADNVAAVGTGMRARGSWGGGPALVWTGDAAFDLYHGVVWDPDDRSWSPLPGPANLIRYAGLINTNPVWDGNEVVAASWATSQGLAWNSTGTEYRELPGMPAPLADPEYGADALATVVDGRVLLVSGADNVPTAWLDAASGVWEAGPSVREGNTGEGCPAQAASTAAGPVAQACQLEQPYVLGSEGWTPLDGALTSGTVWLEVDGSLLVWSVETANDGTMTPRAFLWVPPDRPEQPSSTGAPTNPEIPTHPDRDTQATQELEAHAAELLPGWEILDSFEYPDSEFGSSVFVELRGPEGLLAKLAIYNVPNPAHRELLEESAGVLTRTGSSTLVVEMLDDGREIALLFHDPATMAGPAVEVLGARLDVTELEQRFAEVVEAY